VASVEIDPRHIGPAGIPISNGDWSIILRWGGVGIGRSAKVRPDERSVLPAILPAAFGSPARLAVPGVRADGLSLDITANGRAVADWRTSAIRVERQTRVLEVALPVVAGRRAGASSADLVIRTPAGDRTWPAEVVPRLGVMHLRATIPRGGPGRATIVDAQLRARLGPPYDLDVEIGTATIHVDGSLRVAGFVERGAFARVRGWVAWHGRAAIGELRAGLSKRVIDVAVRLPDPLRRAVVRGYRALRRHAGSR
jgi:hypothetical protein